MKGRLLIIAGSDSGGGAGLQADIKSASAMGAYTSTAVTAVTVQNSLDVHAIHKIPVDIIRGQIRAVLSDIGVDAVKIGMLNDVESVLAVAEEIDEVVREKPLVLDPVMVAKGGAPLLQTDAINQMKAELMLRTALLTPNIPEAELLSGIEIQNPEDMARAAEILLTLGAQAVLVKGGHLPSATITDVLMTPDDTHLFTSRRIETVHTHGTGCTLASAIAAGLAHDMPLYGAVERARIYVLGCIETAPGFGAGHGPLNHLHMSA